MAASMFLSVKSHLSEFKGNADKDTISEASESGTSNSVTSSEELQKLAVILGLNSAEDVYQERFRVDRRRLEAMLADNLEDAQTAQAFFHRVMTETNTLVNWPARLKIGARSRKDPHVRVAGRQDDVKLAREKIMQLLDTRGNRVTMKIDVSYTDHSHIIGKGGLTIKRVMEETGCHIHFPDSNRTSAVEKSNQVSIAGDMDKVERARARVRALTPLVFSFELPIVGSLQSLPDVSSPYVQQIQDQYNVQVMLRNRPKLHAHVLAVKGTQWEVGSTMEATTLLMNYMCGPLASQTQVQMSLEITPMHHSIVIGRGAEQLKMIMKSTNTQIMFPDAEDPNIPVIRKSCVTITGQINDVYAARQQLVGSLPVVVIFDVAEESCRVEAEAAGALMHKHNVYINVRRKPKQGIASVVIKGIERCVGDIYEARRELCGGNELPITAEIPESYSLTMPRLPAYPRSPQGDYAAGPVYTHNPPTPVGAFPSPLSPAVFSSFLVPSPPPRAPALLFPDTHSPLPYNNWSPLCVGTEGSVPQLLAPGLSSSHTSSGYQSNFTGSSASLDAQNTSGGGSNNSPAMSPISKAHSSPAPSTDTDRSQQEIASIIQELPLSERRAPGCEKKTLETMKLSPLAEYTHLKAEASKAMRSPVGSGYRVPTPRWAGYYFSHTSPGQLNLTEEPTTPENKAWPRSEVSRPLIVERESTPPARAHCRYTQLYELLHARGMNKYIDLFKKHELDLGTFASLNEADLVEIGVSAFGARRKMMLLITELQKQKAAYTGTPGSERKLTLNSPPHYDIAALPQDKW